MIHQIKINKNWLFFSIFLLGSIVLLYTLLPKSQVKKTPRSTHLKEKQGPYFLPVKIEGYTSSGALPWTSIEVEGKLVKVKIDTGFSGGIILPHESLKNIQQKSFLCTSHYLGFRGKAYQSEIFEVPEIWIGNLKLHNPGVEETNPEFLSDASFIESKNGSNGKDMGSLGWKLFYNFNFFLDCKTSRLAFCDSLETLHKQGYPVEEFIEAPLLLNNNFIEFIADTEMGSIRCMLDTGCTGNMLNKDLANGVNDHMVLNQETTYEEFMQLNAENKDMMGSFDIDDIYEASTFKIGRKDFGAVTFRKIRSPLQVEAVIGMEFLESTLVFIDFPARKIYFYQQD